MVRSSVVIADVLSGLTYCFDVDSFWYSRAKHCRIYHKINRRAIYLLLSRSESTTNRNKRPEWLHRAWDSGVFYPEGEDRIPKNTNS